MIEAENMTSDRNYKGYDFGESGVAVFIRRCSECARFVKPDKHITLNGLDELMDEPNATCKKHGRIKMIFEGFFSREELGDST